MRTCIQIGLVAFAVSLAVGCGGMAAVVRDSDTVVQQLRARGVDVQPEGMADQPLLSQVGQAFRIGVDGLEIYEYRSESSAVLDAQELKRADLSPFGQIHVYQGGNIIALYFGDNLEVQGILTDVVGPPL